MWIIWDLDYPTIHYDNWRMPLQNLLNHLVSVVLRIHSLIYVTYQEHLVLIFLVTLEWRAHNHLMLIYISFMHKTYSQKYNHKCRTIHSKLLKKTVETLIYLGSWTSWCCLDIPIDIFMKYCHEIFTNHFYVNSNTLK